jgi:hypothetical protein
MSGTFLAVVDFNQLFLKPNQFHKGSVKGLYYGALFCLISVGWHSEFACCYKILLTLSLFIN